MQALRRRLDATRKTQSVYAFRRQDDDFEPLAAEIDKLFRSLGWISRMPQSRDDAVREEMELSGVDRDTAEFIVAMERGEVDGDVIALDEQGRRVPHHSRLIHKPPSDEIADNG